MKKLIIDKGKAKRFVDPGHVAKALGAEDTGVEVNTKSGPISLFALRQFLVSRLHSTGGRPRLKGTEIKRNKISFFNEDWKKLEEISKYFKEKEGINVSSSQIVAALIHADVAKIDPSRLKISSK